MDVILVLLKEGDLNIVNEMGSDGMMYVPGFMKTGSGVEAILRFSSAS
jgi:hypothetical protein